MDQMSEVRRSEEALAAAAPPPRATEVAASAARPAEQAPRLAASAASSAGESPSRERGLSDEEEMLSAARGARRSRPRPSRSPPHGAGMEVELQGRGSVSEEL
ncbi:unnamed protein product [Prorocentrum cordatum]|uniref:Uncharacterized protein n=1 Tax=Prorocentrum cordatum TaxID=2364126 RepID=A0ABN9XK85_9DINO|nr:unnamed protein product [Polarella glacialis]